MDLLGGPASLARPWIQEYSWVHLPLPQAGLWAVRTAWDAPLFSPFSFLPALPPLPTHPVPSLPIPQECVCSFPLLSCFSCLARFALHSCSSACQGWVPCAFSPFLPPFPFLCSACLLSAPLACSLPLLLPLFSRCWLRLAVLVPCLLPSTRLRACVKSQSTDLWGLVYFRLPERSETGYCHIFETFGAVPFRRDLQW